MLTTRRFIIACASCSFLCLSTAAGQDPKNEVLTKPLEDRRDLTLLRRITDRTFVHDLANVAYTIPEGWKEIRPHRLARKIDPRISTVLGIQKSDRDMVASLYWIPMSMDQRLSEWVREKPVGGEYGEEYETLKAVYGKDRVSLPVKIRSGEFEVYRINIKGGPERGEKYDGTLFVFDVETGGRTWLLKARVSYPKGEMGESDKYALEVLRGYSRVPAKGGIGKAPEIDEFIPKEDAKKN